MCTNHCQIKYCFTDYNTWFGPKYYYWDLFFSTFPIFRALFEFPFYYTVVYNNDHIRPLDLIRLYPTHQPILFTGYFTYTCFYRRLYLDITCLFHYTHTQTRERANQINIYLIARRLTVVEYYNYIRLCDNPDDARRDEIEQNAII